MASCRALLLVAALASACQPPPIVPTRKGELKLATSPNDAPQLEASYDFGAMGLGSSAMLEVTAKNVGRDALTVSKVTLEAADTGAYFVRGGTGRLEPGASVTCTITFSPVRVGAQTARLVFEHDADAPLPALSLTGTGR